jgi:hypothetical protein
VSKKASSGLPQARIRARFRPTSLARYAVTNLRTWKRGQPITVRVAPGRVKTLRRAFPQRLRAGTQMTDAKHNMGLAIRLKPGETPRNKKFFVAMKGGRWLMYAPSIQQAFISRSGAGVAKDTEHDVLRDLEREWMRLAKLGAGR